MCLISKYKKAFIADEDIYCYKILSMNSRGEYRTHYLKQPVNDSIINGNETFKAIGDEEIVKQQYKSIFSYRYHIGKGFIHTYDRKRAIVQRCNWHSLYNKIFECVIPKGTKYYMGENDDYASKEIRFIREVPIRELDSEYNAWERYLRKGSFYYLY